MNRSNLNIFGTSNANRSRYVTLIVTKINFFTYSLETQTRFLQDRIDTLERNLADICNQLAAYTRRLAATRDEGDQLASHVLQFAEGEKINSTMKAALTNFADNLAAVGDYRNAEVFIVERNLLFYFFLGSLDPAIGSQSNQRAKLIRGNNSQGKGILNIKLSL